jgi:hypothetical protein
VEKASVAFDFVDDISTYGGMSDAVTAKGWAVRMVNARYRIKKDKRREFP